MSFSIEVRPPRLRVSRFLAWVTTITKFAVLAGEHVGRSLTDEIPPDK